MSKISRLDVERAEQAFARSLGHMDVASQHLDSVRLHMRESIAPASRGEVFESEITGITEIPAELNG